MVGWQALWRVWRGEWPAGSQLRAAAMRRLRGWAGYLDPDFSHSQRVAQWALLLYDGLKNAGLVTNHGSDKVGAGNVEALSLDCDWRAVLEAAALMHDIGKARGEEKHQKRSYRMIRRVERPLGWSAREMEMAALVARYHRGALPRPQGKRLQVLELPHRPVAMELAGVVRLAKPLDTRRVRHRDGGADSPRLKV